MEVVTPRKEFVYAKYPDNHIIAISVIFTHRDKIEKYFLYWGSYDVKNPNFNSIKFTREADLLKYFYSLITKLTPDRMYTFNGDSFDIPYLIERSSFHSVIPVGFEVKSKRTKIRFQWETLKYLYNPNIEQIDFIRVFLKWFPGLPNYKLETIAKIYLGEGKSDIVIEQMFLDFYMQSPEGTEKLADYSVKDSMLLAQLNQKLGIDQLLENICNQSGSLLNDLIETYNSDIVSKIAYINDPASIFLTGGGTNTFLFNFESNKVYYDICVYDYSNYYIIEMQQHDDDYTFGLSERIKNLPGPLKAEMFWSKYYTGDAEILKDLIMKLDVIEISNTILKTIGTAKDETETLILLDRYTHLLTLGKVSYIAENWLNQIVRSGTAKLLKSKFKLADSFLIECLKYLFDEGGYPAFPKLEDVPIESLVIREKVKAVDEYPTGSDKFKLSSQLDIPIKTWAMVDYYMTTRGPILVSKIGPNDVIDANNT